MFIYAVESSNGSSASAVVAKSVFGSHSRQRNVIKSNKWNKVKRVLQSRRRRRILFSDFQRIVSFEILYFSVPHWLKIIMSNWPAHQIVTATETQTGWNICFVIVTAAGSDLHLHVHNVCICKRAWNRRKTNWCQIAYTWMAVVDMWLHFAVCSCIHISHNASQVAWFMCSCSRNY